MPTAVEISRTQSFRFRRPPPKPLQLSPKLVLPPSKPAETLIGQHWLEDGVLWVTLGNQTVSIPAGFADRPSWARFAGNFAEGPMGPANYVSGPFGCDDFPFTCTNSASGYLIAAKTNVVGQIKTFLNTNNFGTATQREMARACFPARLMQNISVPSTNGNVTFTAQYVSMTHWVSWQEGINGMVFPNQN